MARSRRPELEKDNPVAPQVYSRRKRQPASGHPRRHPALLETLQSLTDAAESFVTRTPRSKRSEAERKALLDAITGAQLLLSVEQFPPSVH